MSESCTCIPCPGRGTDGHRMPHCAECCFGSLIAEYDLGCPIAAHAEMAERQYGEPAP